MLKIKSRVISLITAAAVAVPMALMPKPAVAQVEQADKPITGVRLNELDAPHASKEFWNGSFIYFGCYNGSPLKFRIMARSMADVFGIDEPVITLDCDNIIENMSLFSSVEQMASVIAGDIWKDSPARKWLDGEFYNSAFSEEEKALIAKSGRGDGHSSPRNEKYIYDLPFSSSYFFPIDVRFVEPRFGGMSKTTLYDLKGLSKSYLGKASADEPGTETSYWLGSAFESFRYELTSNSTGAVPLVVSMSADGQNADIISAYSLSENKGYTFDAYNSVGISPMMNIKSNNILFSSKVNESDDHGRSSYTITIQDDGMVIVPDGTPQRSGNTITVAHDILQGADRIDRICVVITDKELLDNGSEVLYFSEIADGRFTLSDELGRMDPSDYHAYIFGQKVNGEKKCDYASAPVEIHIPAPADVDSVSVSIDAPEAGVELGNASCSSASSSTVWKTDDRSAMTVTGKARFNTAYFATVTLTPEKGTRFTDNTKFTGVPADYEKRLNTDGTMTLIIKYPATRKGKLLTLDVPAEKVFPHGTTENDIKKSLPSYFSATCEDTRISQIYVTWDESTLNYDPAVSDTSQSFTIRGTLDCTYADPADFGDVVTLNITVSSHSPSDAWSYDEDTHFRYCSGSGCGVKLEQAQHDFEDTYDFAKWRTNGGSYLDYPIKKCRICSYIMQSSGDETIVTVTSAGSDEPKPFTDFMVAWTYAQNEPGSVLTLMKDVKVPDKRGNFFTIEANHNITIDLNGKTFTMPSGQLGYQQFVISGGSLTVNDSAGGGRVVYQSAYLFTVKSGRLTINGGTFGENKQMYTIMGDADSSCDVRITNGDFPNGMDIKGGSLAIAGGSFNDSSVRLKISAKLSGGTFAEIYLLGSDADFQDLLQNGHIYEYTSGDNAGQTTDGSDVTKPFLTNVRVVLTNDHVHSAFYVSQVGETCTINGAKEHYECVCGALFSDSAAQHTITAAELDIPASHIGGTANCKNGAICTRCGKEYGKRTTDHRFAGGSYGFSDSEHWLTCTVCGTADSAEPHAMSSSDDCTIPKNCSICGYASGEALPEHDWSAWTHDDAAGNHSRHCTQSGCQAEESYSCSGGSATCTQPAVCEVCGSEYGSADPQRHSSSDTRWESAETTHKLVHSCCGTAAGAEIYHDWNSANVCRDCGYSCVHRFTAPDYSWSGDGTMCTAERVCSFCNENEAENANISFNATVEQSCTTPEISTCTAVFTNPHFKAQVMKDVETKPALGHEYSQAWTANEAQHWHQCIRCDETSDISAHCGGTADCITPAVCRICGLQYGGPDPDNHRGSCKYVSISETSHRQEYSCCGKVTIAEEAHTFDKYKVCTKCGYGCTHRYGKAVYSWSKDLLSCTAQHGCSQCSYIESEIASSRAVITSQQTCTSPELTTYTAVFKGEGFAAQTRSDIQTKSALGHEYSEVWTANEAQHWHKCIRCDKKSDISAHSGGKSDCISPAVCGICDRQYGGTNPDNHHGTLKYTSVSSKLHRQEYSCCGKVTAEEPHKFSTGKTCEKCGFTKSGSGSSGGGIVKPSGPVSEISLPTLNGKEMSWENIAKTLARMNPSDDIEIRLNGTAIVPADAIRAIAGRKLKVIFSLDSTKCWITDGSDISEVTAADFSVLPGRALTDGTRGILGMKLKLNEVGIPAVLRLQFRSEFAGEFANLFTLSDGTLKYVNSSRLSEDGSAVISGLGSSGEYLIMVCEFSDCSGDANNDGIVNALDASAILKAAVGTAETKNPRMADYNEDGSINALDASAILVMVSGMPGAAQDAALSA